VTVAWAAAVVLMASAAAAVVTRGGRPAAAPLPVLDGRFLAVVQHGNQPRVVELTVRGTGASIVERADLRETDLPAPDGRTLATTFQAPDGWNLAVRVGSEPPRVLTSAAGDEYPVDWSPDGRYLLYAHRRILADGRTQSHTLSVHDLVADTAWRLSTLESAERPGAEWSPDGTRIAFTADVRGAPDVFVVDFDGANRRNVTGHAAWDGDPAWAPGGERLAFVSRRHGSADVYLVRPDGSEIQRLSQSADDDRHPRWGSPTAIVALAGADDYRVLTVLDTYTGQRHQLPGPDNLVTLGGRLHPRSPWLERLSMTPRAQRASPGQSLTLRVAATGSDGNPLGGTIPIAWSVSDSSVIRLVAPGRVQIVGTGQATVVASAAGWRADTLALYAIPLAERAVTAVLVETWQHGLDTGRWRPFGDPSPLTRRTGGPEGSGVFANNGDAFFVSGAVTVAAFSLGDGLSVEVDGRMPFTGKLHQEFGLALYAEEHADSLLASGAAPALVELRVRGPSGTDPAEAWIATAERREVLPLPDEPGRWHRYGLQVLANGDVELVVDGRLWWRAAELLARRAESVRVGLGFQSFETEIQHGRLRVFTPPRYYLPEVALDGDTTDRE
jgi:hypothetical protein